MKSVVSLILPNLDVNHIIVFFLFISSFFVFLMRSNVQEDLVQ